MEAIPEFIPFPKVARLSRACVISEKIDGTNSSVMIAPGSPDTPMAIAAWHDAEAAKARRERRAEKRGDSSSCCPSPDWAESGGQSTTQDGG